MKMTDGERQVAPTIDGIRRDHVARYEFAARTIPPGSKVIDFACGIGYGAKILAEAGHQVHAFDIDEAALAYGEQHYSHPGVTRSQADAMAPGDLGEDFDVAICFETIEHLANPRPLLTALRAAAPDLICSVPNEDVFPYTGQRFHFRHYRKRDISDLLASVGWAATEWLGQEGPDSDVEPGMNGRTLLAIARRDAPVAVDGGKHIAILGMGPSVHEYLKLVKQMGGRSKFCDEVWVINALGDVFDCDMIFHMDDVRIQEIRAAARPDSNIAAMLAWLKTTKKPVMTGRAHPDYPALIEFPLAEVVNAYPCGYFNSTAAYAVAYAIHRNAAKITVFGNDFTYPDAHHAERGRACVEFWLGIAHARGIQLSVPRQTSLLDALYPLQERFYGYDTLEVGIRREAGQIVFDFKERTELPTADEIEARYDHDQHPNPLMAEASGPSEITA